MNADTKQDYTIDEVALWKAGIDPRTCYESVQCAVDRKLPGYEKAESYLEQLWEQVEAGTLKPSLVLPPPEPEGRMIVIGLDEVYLSAEDAENWQPEQDMPLKQPKGEELSGKSLTTHLNLERALIKLVIEYESGNRMPKDYPHEHILNENGNINAEALKRLLQDICEKTPKRADVLIKKALQSQF